MDTEFTVEDVQLMSWGTDQNHMKYAQEDLQLPEDDELDLTYDYHEDIVLGTVKNFRKTEDGIIADVHVNDERLAVDKAHERDITIAPKFEGEV